MEQQNILGSPELFRQELARLQQEETKAVPTQESDEIAQDSTVFEDNNNDIEEGVSEEEVTGESHNADVDLDESEEDPEDYKIKKFIPKSRLNKEIEKRRTLEELLGKEKEDRIRSETQLQMLEAQLQQSQKSTVNDNIPEHIEQYEPLDPEAHNIYMKKIAELEDKLTSVGQNAHMQTQQLQYYNIISEQEKAFQKEHPDFLQALEHLKNVEKTVASNFYSNPAEAEQIAHTKLQNILVNVVQKGQNAPEVMYNMAKTYGYNSQPKAATKHVSNLESININQQKSTSINSINNNATMRTNPGSIDFSQLLNDPDNPNSGVNVKKFTETLKRLK